MFQAIGLNPHQNLVWVLLDIIHALNWIPTLQSIVVVLGLYLTPV